MLNHQLTELKLMGHKFNYINSNLTNQLKSYDITRDQLENFLLS